MLLSNAYKSNIGMPEETTFSRQIGNHRQKGYDQYRFRLHLQSRPSHLSLSQ